MTNYADMPMQLQASTLIGEYEFISQRTANRPPLDAEHSQLLDLHLSPSQSVAVISVRKKQTDQITCSQKVRVTHPSGVARKQNAPPPNVRSDIMCGGAPRCLGHFFLFHPCTINLAPTVSESQA